MKTLYLIPARGGSKGIPGKNIKPFCGQPLICRAIDQAREAGAADRDICVSTDSPEIRRVAEGYGLETPFLRPAELSTDRAGSYGVIMHALEWYARERGVEYDRVVLLQPTSPLRTPDDIREAVGLWRPDCDMVVTVCEARTNPYYNAFEADAEGFLHISKGEGGYTRRQDAPAVWEYNGAVYVMTAASLRRGPMSGFHRIIPCPMPAERSVDLDTPLDWMMAEELCRRGV
ncbi:MAG: acylneuraminate cytidylyltransferase family protein [Muribaculaceae bacterium]|nr:acylneuraminate cytidylyltransferase family protein [Muribaculaceae bacterium]